MNSSTHLDVKFDHAEVRQLADALAQSKCLSPDVASLLQTVDRSLSQRVSELQSAQKQLAEESAALSRVEKQLRQAQKMEALGQLAGVVAHDFNNMLTVVQGNASLLLSGKPAHSPDAPPLRSICAAVDRTAEKVAAILAFCRKQAAELRPTNLQETLTAVSQMMPRLLPSAIKLDAHATPGLPLVKAEGTMMETLLTNLVLNARDAMPKGGILCITAAPVTIGPAEVNSNPEARPGAFVRLSVSDTGTGIEPDIMPRIFEPFFTTKAATQGAGLGLAIVSSIVKQHQGWVEVQSKVNCGTAVHVFLPALAAIEARPSTPAAATAKKAPSTASETILVVDDEPDLRELVSQVLQSTGYKVLTAGSGAEAMQRWAKRQGDIHLLLTDIVMPDGFTGRKLADQLHREDPRLRVIYTSGYSAGMPGTDLANMDDRCFLAKPYRPAMLLKVVRECLDQPATAGRSAQQAA